MTLDESRFHRLADALLQDIADKVDDELGDELDADIQGGILTIHLPDGGQFIVNKNAPLCQIWLSSPVSGAFHFDYDEDKDAWLSTRDRSVTLLGLLGRELAQKAGRAFSL